jgi:ribosomal protein L25 (general stress protein Ctc)
MSVTTTLLMCFLSVIVATGDGKSGGPIMKVHAYQWKTVPDIPGLRQGKGDDSGQDQFSIYLETDPASKLEGVGIWMNGKEYSVESTVKPSPVRFDSPVIFEQEERNIAVPKTANLVTEIIVKTTLPGKALDKPVAQMLKENKAVVELTSGGKTILVPVKAFQTRHSPIVKVHAYQRETVAGVPGLPQTKGAAFPQRQYSIYLETNPASKFEVVGVWMNGMRHSVNSMVKPSPVKFDNPVVFEQEERNIAVRKTGNQVTEIIVGTSTPGKEVDKAVAQLLKENAAVVELTSDGKTIWVPVKTFQKRDPVYLP